MSRYKHSRPRGFTLTEVLVVIGIIVILISLLVPAVLKVREEAARKQTANNLKTCSLGIYAYNDMHRRLPPAADGGRLPDLVYSRKLTLWQHIYPYIEQDGWTIRSGRLVPGFLSSADESSTRLGANSPINFAANIRIFGNTTADISTAVEVTSGMDSVAGLPRTFLDGTANTIMLGTVFHECGPTGASYLRQYNATPDLGNGAFFGAGALGTSPGPTIPPNTLKTSAGQAYQLAPTRDDCLAVTGQTPNTSVYLQSFGWDGLQVGLADASIRMIFPNISATTFARLVHPADGQPLGSDWLD